MTRVKQRELSVSRDTLSKTEHEVYKVAFGVLVGAAAIIGILAFASLGVGVTKAVMLIIGA